MNRQCSRPGCPAQASATLAYDYRSAMVTVERLAASAHPMSYDLCDEHADRTKVPNGWSLDDRRVATVSMLVDRPAFLAS